MSRKNATCMGHSKCVTGWNKKSPTPRTRRLCQKLVHKNQLHLLCYKNDNKITTFIKEGINIIVWDYSIRGGNALTLKGVLCGRLRSSVPPFQE